MRTGTLRALTILLPLLSLLISVGIVRHQYARRDRLTFELAQTESEFARLKGLLPKKAAPPACDHEKHDSHDHDGHDHEGHDHVH